jgi:hypothetical protein
MQERTHATGIPGLGSGDAVTDARHNFGPGVPDLGVPHLDDDESGRLEPRPAVGVVDGVGERGVIALALHLDDDRVVR